MLSQVPESIDVVMLGQVQTNSFHRSWQKFNIHAGLPARVYGSDLTKSDQTRSKYAALLGIIDK